ncbi:chemotaxis protein CheW [Endozoicomonas sp. Mp262]|uniref:chemotaxis protein CheW n=1 Tax=Endozoicomonas sp. Mp262 TaxID=2919499 RepID=UPI0021D820DD
MDLLEDNVDCDVEQMSTVLHFRQASLNCCMDLQHIERVVPIASVQRLPSESPSTVGLLNLNGHGVPIIDLAFHLNVSSGKKHSLDACYIICNGKDGDIGLLTCGIDGIASYPEARFQLQSKFEQSNQPFLSTVNSEYGLAYLLDIERINRIIMGDFQENRNAK